MDNNKQAEIVKTALELENYVQECKDKLDKIAGESFGPEPEQPKMEGYSQPDPNIKFNLIIAFIPFIVAIILYMFGLPSGLISFLVLIGVIWPFFYYIGLHKPKKEAKIQEIKQSEEYQAQCREIDERNRESARKYKEETVPAYQAEYQKWKKRHEEELTAAQDEYNNAVNKLNEHYSQTRIIPKQYQHVYPLSYFDAYMSSSEFTIKEAIEAFEREETRRREEMANQIEAAKVDAMFESNEIASKARRDQWIQEGIKIKQMHNLNKTLKKR